MKDKLVSNAWFWRGECNYQLGNFPAAALDYEQVISKYGSSGKAASAYLKQGMCFIKAGKKDAAKVRLQELIKFHFKSINPKDSFAMWDATYEKIIDLVNKISFDLGLNIICITHEAREVNDISRLSLIGPSFEGKQSLKKLPGIFDIIGRMTWEDIGDDDNEELVTVLTVRSSSEVLAKTRFDPMPSMSGNTTMGKIMGWVHEHCETQGVKVKDGD